MTYAGPTPSPAAGQDLSVSFSSTSSQRQQWQAEQARDPFIEKWSEELIRRLQEFSKECWNDPGRRYLCYKLQYFMKSNAVDVVNCALNPSTYAPRFPYWENSFGVPQKIIQDFFADVCKDYKHPTTLEEQMIANLDRIYKSAMKMDGDLDEKIRSWAGAQEGLQGYLNTLLNEGLFAGVIGGQTKTDAITAFNEIRNQYAGKLTATYKALRSSLENPDRIAGRGQLLKAFIDSYVDYVDDTSKLVSSLAKANTDGIDGVLKTFMVALDVLAVALMVDGGVQGFSLVKSGTTRTLQEAVIQSLHNAFTRRVFAKTCATSSLFAGLDLISQGNEMQFFTEFEGNEHEMLGEMDNLLRQMKEAQPSNENIDELRAQISKALTDLKEGEVIEWGRFWKVFAYAFFVSFGFELAGGAVRPGETTSRAPVVASPRAPAASGDPARIRLPRIPWEKLFPDFGPALEPAYAGAPAGGGKPATTRPMARGEQVRSTGEKGDTTKLDMSSGRKSGGAGKATGTIDPDSLPRGHRQCIDNLFDYQQRGNIRWRDVKKLLEYLAGETGGVAEMNGGSAMRVKINGETLTIHGRHGGENTLRDYQVKLLREFLTKIGAHK